MINIKLESYFDGMYQQGGFFSAIGGIALIFWIIPKYSDLYTQFGLSLLSIFLILIGLIFMTAYHGLLIETRDKTYLEYVWVLGIRVGKPKRFKRIIRIYINQVNKKTKIAQLTFSEKYYNKYKRFNAYMKLDSGEKILMATHWNEETLSKRVNEYVKKLGNIYAPE